MKILRSFLLIILCGIYLSLSAQSSKPVTSEGEEVSQLINSLPPLHVLIDSAIVKSPFMKFQDAEIMKNQFKLKSVKNNWAKNIGFSGDVIYGTWDYLSLDQNTGTTNVNNQVETRYGTGIYIRLPIYDAVNRNNEVAIAKIELQEAQILKEQREHEIRKLVITQYNTVILNQRLVSVINKNKQSMAIQLQLVEKQFTNGQATIEELSNITDSYNSSLVNYEKAKSDLTISYLILQEIVGIKFQAIKTE